MQIFAYLRTIRHAGAVVGQLVTDGRVIQVAAHADAPAELLALTGIDHLDQHAAIAAVTAAGCDCGQVVSVR